MIAIQVKEVRYTRHPRRVPAPCVSVEASDGQIYDIELNAFRVIKEGELLVLAELSPALYVIYETSNSS